MTILVEKIWVTYIKDLLFQYGYGYVCISQDVGHINMFVSSFKQRLKDCLTQNWSDDLSSSSRCDTYCTFKSFLNIENILSIDIPFYYVHFVFLNGNQLIIEDEYHTIFICPKYVNIRERDIYITGTSVELNLLIL